MARNLFVDLLPARLGELSYVYLLTKRAGRPAEDGLASLFLAVLFDLIALVPLLILAILVRVFFFNGPNVFATGGNIEVISSHYKRGNENWEY